MPRQNFKNPLCGPRYKNPQSHIFIFIFKNTLQLLTFNFWQLILFKHVFPLTKYALFTLIVSLSLKIHNNIVVYYSTKLKKMKKNNSKK